MKLTFLFMLIATLAFAQTTITGTATDESGEAVLGANIGLKGYGKALRGGTGVRSCMGCFHAKTAKIMRRKGGKGLMVQGAYDVIKSHCESKSEAKCRQAPTLCLLCDELSLRTLREIYCAIFSHLQFVYLSQQFGRSHQVKHNELTFLFMLIATLAFAQTTITGTATDESGEAVLGANIGLKGYGKALRGGTGVRSCMGCFHAKTAKIMRRKGGKGLMVQGAYDVI